VSSTCQQRLTLDQHRGGVPPRLARRTVRSDGDARPTIAAQPPAGSPLTGQDQANFIKSFKFFVLFMFANLHDLALSAREPDLLRSTGIDAWGWPCGFQGEMDELAVRRNIHRYSANECSPIRTHRCANTSHVPQRRGCDSFPGGNCTW